MEEINNNNFGKQIVHNFSSVEKKEALFSKKNIFIFVILAIAGVLSGYLLSKFYFSTRTSSFSPQVVYNKNLQVKGQIFGSNDEKTFKDQAQGILKSGGIDGEGEFHLEREGGLSQYVYLTSSALDLAQFVDKKVKVWGATNTAKKAGWLMDVGRLQIIE